MGWKFIVQWSQCGVENSHWEFTCLLNSIFLKFGVIHIGEAQCEVLWWLLYCSRVLVEVGPSTQKFACFSKSPASLTAQTCVVAQASCCLWISSESLCISSDIEKKKPIKKEDVQTLRIVTDKVSAAFLCGGTFRALLQVCQISKLKWRYFVLTNTSFAGSTKDQQHSSTQLLSVMVWFPLFHPSGCNLHYILVALSVWMLCPRLLWGWHLLPTVSTHRLISAALLLQPSVTSNNRKFVLDHSVSLPALGCWVLGRWGIAVQNKANSADSSCTHLLVLILVQPESLLWPWLCCSGCQSCL